MDGRCGYRQVHRKLFASDGEDWCWTIQALYFSEATGILDWYHASEHMWKTAHALFPDQNAATRGADQALALMRDQEGTGLLESTGKQLVGLRLKGPVRRWTEAGALAVTALRAIDLNGYWHSYWNASC